MKRLRTLGVAVLIAGVLLVLGQQINVHGWYAAHGAYRAQVDAFLDGRLALSYAPEAIQHDFAWVNGGVQQVWGLGVAMWQTPFELVGRVIGLTPFPDRIALLAWLALVVFVSLRAWREDGEPWWVRAGCVGVTALLPPFVTLLRGRLGVYEEAAAYAYGAALLLLGGLVCFAKRPSSLRYFVLVAAAGASGFVRPTVWFYGLATMICASLLWRRRRDVAIGVMLFVAGGAALYASNARRFGSGMEFGHRLNLEGLPGNLYATRFSYPFERIGTLAATGELVGSLFDQPERHRRTAFYGKHLHRGQADVSRWREYYFTTFSWPYLPLILVGIVLGARAWRRRDGPVHWLLAWAVVGGAPLFAFYLRSPSVSSRYQLDLAPAFAALLVIAWRWAATRKHGPVIAGVTGAAWVASVLLAHLAGPRLGAAPVGRAEAAKTRDEISRVTPREHALPAMYELDDPWLPADTDVLEQFRRCYDATGAAIDPDAPPIEGDACVQGVRKADEEQWLLWTTVVHDEPPPLCELAGVTCLPDPSAANSGDIDASLIPPPSLFLNMFRWDLETGDVPPSTFAWVSDPQFVELDIRGPANTDWARSVRVALGAQHLHLASIADTPDGVRLRYEPRSPLPRGLQVAFFAFGDDRGIERVRTAFQVTRVRWR